jgi:hypothetical protein
MSHHQDSLFPLIGKSIDYLSEEYVKRLLTLGNSNRMLTTVNPFVGVIRYPSSDFLTPSLSYLPTVQAQNSHYVGFLDMLLPEFVAPVNTGTSYTLLEFKLDGIVRRFLQISAGSTLSQSQTFEDFVLTKFPGANHLMPINKNAIHVLTDLRISGASYHAMATGAEKFVLNTAGVGGSYTPAIEFEFAVSGYRCIME